MNFSQYRIFKRHPPSPNISHRHPTSLTVTHSHSPSPTITHCHSASLRHRHTHVTPPHLITPSLCHTTTLLRHTASLCHIVTLASHHQPVSPASLRRSLRHFATVILRHSSPPQSSPNPTLFGRVRPGMRCLSSLI